MSTGALIIVALRLLIPLSIFRSPLWGALASLLIDAFDVVLIEVLGLGGFDDRYHTLDKLLDTYYLSFLWVVSFRWANEYARWISVVLFPFRVVGVVLFELTNHRVMLFIFPNLFENWWLYCAATARFAPAMEPRSATSSAAILTALLIPKMAQEYLLHYAEAQPWDWIKRHILRGRV